MMKRLVLFGMIFGLASGCDTSGQATVESKVAQAEATAKQINLTGTSWQWVSLVTPEETVEVAQPARYILGFQPEGRLAVRADCNRAFGGYEVGDGRITLTVGGMTRAMCPPGSLSDRFLKELDAAAIYRFDGEALYLDLKDDTGTMKFLPNTEP